VSRSGYVSGAIFFAEDALGQGFTGQADEIDFSLITPRLPDGYRSLGDLEGFVLLAPDIDDDMLADWDASAHGWRAWGRSLSGGAQSKGAGAFASDVHRAVLEVSLNLSDNPNYLDVVTPFGRPFAQWWSRLSSWIELWTDQVLKDEGAPDTYPHVIVWALGRDDWAPLETGRELSPALSQAPSSALAVSARHLQAACDHASIDHTPDLEWILYLRSGRRSDTRLSIVDVATAVELSLSKAISERLADLSGRARDKIIKNANGIVGLMELLRSFEATAPVSVAAVKSGIAAHRNDAVHRGKSPTADELAAARMLAKNILDQYSPIDRPS
jgi:rhodanese-related sulfurtransferase